MDQRVQFIGEWLKGRYTKIDLCEFYGISRPAGDKWIGRYQRLGLDRLKEWSRAAKHHPNAIEPAGDIGKDDFAFARKKGGKAPRAHAVRAYLGG